MTKIYAAVSEIVEYKGAQYMCVYDSDLDNICEKHCAFYEKSGCDDFECLRARRPDKESVHFVKVEGGAQQ